MASKKCKANFYCFAGGHCPILENIKAHITKTGRNLPF